MHIADRLSPMPIYISNFMIDTRQIVFIAAHAVVEHWEGKVLVEESAWGKGELFGGGNWSMYFCSEFIP